MNIYTIKYSEVYCKEYEIEAEEEEEAKAKLVDMLYKGELDSPCECEDSYSEIIHIKKLIHVAVGNNMYRKEFDVTDNTSLIELFVMSGITPYRSTGRNMLTLDGVSIHKEDLFKTLSEFNIDNKAYLLVIPVCSNV